VSQRKHAAESDLVDDRDLLSMEQARALAQLSREAMLGLGVEGKVRLHRLAGRWFVERRSLNAWMGNGAAAA
jgi:hypothetical protein